MSVVLLRCFLQDVLGLGRLKDRGLWGGDVWKVPLGKLVRCSLRTNAGTFAGNGPQFSWDETLDRRISEKLLDLYISISQLIGRSHNAPRVRELLLESSWGSYDEEEKGNLPGAAPSWGCFKEGAIIRAREEVKLGLSSRLGWVCCTLSGVSPAGFPTIVSRQEWGARPLTCRAPLSPPVAFLIAEQLTGMQCQEQTICSEMLRGLQFHSVHTRGRCDVAFNFLVGDDGRVYEGVGWNVQGSHTQGYNNVSLGVAFFGNKIVSTLLPFQPKSCPSSDNHLSPEVLFSAGFYDRPRPAEATLDIAGAHSDCRQFWGLKLSDTDAPTRGSRPSPAALSAAEGLIFYAIQKGHLSPRYIQPLLLKEETCLAPQHPGVSSKACPDITPRSAWEARETHCPQMSLPVKYVIIIHTAGTSCNVSMDCLISVRDIQSFHMDKLDFCDIGYHFLVGQDGAVYEGVGWNVQGSHTYGYNDIALGIAFIGNFVEKPPNAASLDAAQDLIQCAVVKGYLDPNYLLVGHSDVANLLSPGQALYNIIKTWPHFKH
ncbi:Hypothetical predicted protein [Marmota monax]|uniref:Peptidoglycan recognition protein 3 n=1 Tax=Marmota monax TaxID=9995 RepID=A0A5E4A820_MARMO|nr:Hypothetical predicted protein [Marmota monax]